MILYRVGQKLSSTLASSLRTLGFVLYTVCPIDHPNSLCGHHRYRKSLEKGKMKHGRRAYPKPKKVLDQKTLTTIQETFTEDVCTVYLIPLTTFLFNLSPRERISFPKFRSRTARHRSTSLHCCVIAQDVATVSRNLSGNLNKS